MLSFKKQNPPTEKQNYEKLFCKQKFNNRMVEAYGFIKYLLTKLKNKKLSKSQVLRLLEVFSNDIFLQSAIRDFKQQDILKKLLGKQNSIPCTKTKNLRDFKKHLKSVKLAKNLEGISKTEILAQKLRKKGLDEKGIEQFFSYFLKTFGKQGKNEGQKAVNFHLKNLETFIKRDKKTGKIKLNLRGLKKIGFQKRIEKSFVSNFITR